MSDFITTADMRVMSQVMSPEEIRAVWLMRAVKRGDPSSPWNVSGRGHGSIQIEIIDGMETHFKQQFHERNKKVLTK